MVKKKGGDIECELLEEIVKFCDERCEEDAVVVSCDQNFANGLFTSISEDYLVVTGNDLNSCSFAKELGKLFLCDKFTLFMETSNLNKTGKERLHVIVEKCKSLFDNRVRVILVGDSCFETLSEKRFDQKVENEDSTEPFGRENPAETLLPPKFLMSELNKMKSELKKALQEKEDSNQKVKGLEKENASLKTKVENLQKTNFIVETELVKLKDAMANVNHVDFATQTSQVPPECKQASTNSKATQKNSIVVRDIESQTKKVEVTSSPLSVIVSKLEQDLTRSLVEKVHVWIKNFACSVVNTRQPSGRFHCKVKVTKGKHIMDCFDLLNFEAEDETMEGAKLAAFNVFVARLKVEADK